MDDQTLQPQLTLDPQDAAQPPQLTLDPAAPTPATPAEKSEIPPAELG